MDYRFNTNKFPVKRVHIQLNKQNSKPRQETKIPLKRPVVSTTNIKRAPLFKQPINIPPKPNIISKKIERADKAPIRSRNSRNGYKTRSKSSVEATKHETLLQQYHSKINSIKNSGSGKLLAIVACGPSVNEIELDKILNNDKIDIMCINRPDKRLWPTKYWLFCDQTQYARSKDLWESYGGTIINASSIRVRHKNQILIKGLTGKGFSFDMQKGFYIGRSSTYAAMQVALWMNYDKILLFGLDMCAVDGKLHHYGKNLDVTDEVRIQRFDREAENFDNAMDILGEHSKRFIMLSNYNKYEFANKMDRQDHTKIGDIIQKYM